MTTSSGGSEGFRVGSGESPGDAVLRCVAAEKGCEVLDLAPLQDTIDVHALDQLFEAPGVEALEFSYEGFDVSVEPDRIYLTEQQ
jgi:hypothetical protein